MLDAAVTAPLNHLLRGESWALKRMKAYAGKTVQFSVAPFALALTVAESGEVKPAENLAVADTRFIFSLSLLPRLLVRDETAYKDVQIEGDTDFAGAIAYVAKNLRWDAAEDLSRIVGDIAAQRIVNTAQSFVRWSQQSLDSLAHSAAEYWTEEQPLIAKADHVKRFIADVDVLRDDVERLDKRLQKLLSA
jgi:ubiquinone biosynthesis protein UbiJ